MAGDSGRGSEPRTVLEGLLWQQDQTYEEVAAAFTALSRTLAERATITPRHLRRLASGERAGTTPVTRRVLQTMFGRPLDELLAPYAGVRESAPSSRSSEKEILDLAAQRARKFSMTASQSNLSDSALDELKDDVHWLALSYPQVPLNEILSQLVSMQDSLFTLLEGRQRPNHSRQLYFLAAVVGGLLAKAAADLSNPQTALAQARMAFMCADNSDHEGLKAWIRGLQALIAYWAGRPLESVKYAQSGGEFALRSRGTMKIWLPVAEARAWAAAGNAASANSAIQRAEDAWDDVSSDDLDEMGGTCTFTRSRQVYYAADALAWLPSEASNAERFATEAVAAYSDTSAPEWSFADQAGSMTDLAVARISLGDVEGAAAAIAPVLELPPENRIDGIVNSVQRVRRALVRASSDSSLCADMQEQIEMFTRTPLKT